MSFKSLSKYFKKHFSRNKKDENVENAEDKTYKIIIDSGKKINFGKPKVNSLFFSPKSSVSVLKHNRDKFVIEVEPADNNFSQKEISVTYFQSSSFIEERNLVLRKHWSLNNKMFNYSVQNVSTMDNAGFKNDEDNDLRVSGTYPKIGRVRVQKFGANPQINEVFSIINGSTPNVGRANLKFNGGKPKDGENIQNDGGNAPKDGGNTEQ